MSEVICARPDLKITDIPPGAVIGIHGGAKGFRPVRVIKAEPDGDGRWLIESEPATEWGSQHQEA